MVLYYSICEFFILITTRRGSLSLHRQQLLHERGLANWPSCRTGADELTIWYICKDITQVRLRIKNQFSRAALLIDNKIYTVKLYEIFKEKNKIDLVYVGTVRQNRQCFDSRCNRPSIHNLKDWQNNHLDLDRQTRTGL